LVLSGTEQFFLSECENIVTDTNTGQHPSFYDLSNYTSDELIELWSSPKGMENKGLLAASLMDERTHFTVLSRMVKEPMDVLSGDNVNWPMTNLTEQVLVSILPMVDGSQAGGALLVWGWIQWVNGRLDLAMESFQKIDEETNFRSALTDVMYRKVADAVQPAGLLPR
jgi:hypothetical protein